MPPKKSTAKAKPKAKAKAPSTTVRKSGSSKATVTNVKASSSSSSRNLNAEPVAPSSNSAFKISLGQPSWKHAKCAVCKLKIGADSTCFEFRDMHGLRQAEGEAAKQQREKRETAEKKARQELKQKRELKERNPEAYKQKYKRFSNHYIGCACCAAMGISLPGDDFSECEEVDPDGNDSLDDEEEQIGYMGMYDPLDSYCDMYESGRRQGKFTWTLHPTARCLGAWRKLNWWEKYRSLLPVASGVEGYQSLENSVGNMGGKNEFKQVWDGIRTGTKSLTQSGPSSSSSSSANTNINSVTDRGVLSSAQFSLFKQKLAGLSSTKKPDLLRMLKKNEITGVSQLPKSHLAELVAVNQALGGALAPCPKCNRGQLDFDRITGEVACRGYKRGMTGWVHCLGPAHLGKPWEKLGRRPWREGLAEGPQPRAARGSARRNLYGYGGGGSFYDDYDPFDGFDFF